jgi:Ca2+-binding RTX toxin-like protein
MTLITGTSSADRLIGTAGQDVLNGLEDNDLLIGGAGADQLDGGIGTDTVSYFDSDQSVSINLQFNTAAGGHAQGDTYISIENISGSNLADSILGDGAANLLNGNAASDSLRGLAGNDTLIGGQGADLLEGDNGIDTVDYSGSRLGVSASLAQHAGHLGDAEGDTYDTIENLIGSIKADTLEGDDSTNLLIGGAGADVLKGNGGTDTVDYSGSSSGVSVSIADNNNHFGDAEGDTFDRIENLNGSSHDDILAGDAVANIISGGQGNDSLLGRTGNDTLIGGEGNDSLSGGPGADTLTGSTGADTFIYQITPLDTGPTIDTCDFISDFEHGTDKIDLSTMDAALNKPGNDAFTFISGGFTDSGQVRVIHDVHQVNGQIFGSTFVHMNTDASPDVDNEIHLKGLLTLTASDFIL